MPASHDRDVAPTSGDETRTSQTLRLKQAEARLRLALEPVLHRAGISFEQWQVVAALQANPGIRMTDLAELAVLPAATLTRHVDRLVERALVLRRIDPADKRRAVVALSAMGRRLAARLLDAEEQVGLRIDEPTSVG